MQNCTYSYFNPYSYLLSIRNFGFKNVPISKFQPCNTKEDHAIRQFAVRWRCIYERQRNCSRQWLRMRLSGRHICRACREWTREWWNQSQSVQWNIPDQDLYTDPYSDNLRQRWVHWKLTIDQLNQLCQKLKHYQCPFLKFAIRFWCGGDRLHERYRSDNTYN